MSKDTCPHPEFEVWSLVSRIEEPRPMRFMLDVHVRCATCKVRFEFRGLPMGLNFQHPTVSPDQFELRAPIEPNAHVTTLMAGDKDCGWPGDRPAVEIFCTKQDSCPKHWPHRCP